MERFGCVSNERYLNPRTGLQTYFLTFPDGTTRLEIMSRPEVTAPETTVCRGGYIHLAVALGSREAVDAKTRELQAAGYPCLSGPRTTGDGCYESCLAGPEGILIEITL